MTTILPKDRKCALCNRSSRQIVIGSTNTLGKYPDLDTRPPEMMRSTIQWWVQTCPSCGFCNSDISEFIGKADIVVKTEKYQKQLNDQKYIKLANAFLCQAMIHEANNEYREAGWACIHAAWACDDVGSEDCSRECRQRALLFIEKTRQLNQKFTSQDGAEAAIIVDLLRRSGQFDLALKKCDEALKTRRDSNISKVLSLERILIGERDLRCHTISEIKDQQE
jgi:hypothetical protein